MEKRWAVASAVDVPSQANDTLKMIEDALYELKETEVTSVQMLHSKRREIERLKTQAQNVKRQLDSLDEQRQKVDQEMLFKEVKLTIHPILSKTLLYSSVKMDQMMQSTVPHLPCDLNVHSVICIGNFPVQLKNLLSMADCITWHD